MDKSLSQITFEFFGAAEDPRPYVIVQQEPVEKPTAKPARDFVALGVLAALLDDPGTGRLTKRLAAPDTARRHLTAGEE